MARAKQPTAEAFEFEIQGINKKYNAYIELVDGIDSTQKEWHCRYRAEDITSGDYVFLASPTIFDSNVINTFESDKIITECLDVIRLEIDKVFSPNIPTIPQKGFERVAWVIKYGLEANNNVISRK